MPLPFKVVQIPSVIGINAKTTGPTKIFTTEDGIRNFYVMGAAIECTSSSLVITPMTASLGTNASSYNNIQAVALMTGLTGTGLHFPIFLTAASAVIPPNTDVFLNITIGAVATAQTITAHVLGFYN